MVCLVLPGLLLGGSRQQLQLPPPPAQEEDSHVKCCELCDDRFTLLRPRNVCRSCPKLVCSTCSAHRVVLRHLGDTKACRVCDACYEALANDGKLADALAESPRAGGDSGWGGGGRRPSVGLEGVVLGLGLGGRRPSVGGDVDLSGAGES